MCVSRDCAPVAAHQCEQDQRAAAVEAQARLSIQSSSEISPGAYRRGAIRCTVVLRLPVHFDVSSLDKAPGWGAGRLRCAAPWRSRVHPDSGRRPMLRAGGITRNLGRGRRGNRNDILPPMSGRPVLHLPGDRCGLYFFGGSLRLMRARNVRRRRQDEAGRLHRVRTWRDRPRRGPIDTMLAMRGGQKFQRTRPYR